MAGSKTPNPIDVHVGSRVRLRRMMLGMSQETLGDHLGVTFQQVQKNEKGINRIGSSRLQQIARVLDTPVSYFFEDAPGEQLPGGGFAETDVVNRVLAFLSSSEGIDLNRAFIKIRHDKARRKVIELVQAIARESD